MPKTNLTPTDIQIAVRNAVKEISEEEPSEEVFQDRVNALLEGTGIEVRDMRAHIDEVKNVEIVSFRTKEFGELSVETFDAAGMAVYEKEKKSAIESFKKGEPLVVRNFKSLSSSFSVIQADVYPYATDENGEPLEDENGAPYIDLSRTQREYVQPLDYGLAVIGNEVIDTDNRCSVCCYVQQPGPEKESRARLCSVDDLLKEASAEPDRHSEHSSPAREEELF